MKRNIDINEISDGEKYTNDHMVRISCNDCEGCHKCCLDMGNNIVLDPYDIYLITTNLGRDFKSFINNELELNIVDGITLPNIRMNNDKKACSFLSDMGRCVIHAFRPGICRLYPLARIYENDSFYYIHQIYECDHPSKSKIKIKKWLDIPALSEYEKFVNSWHYFLKDMEAFAKAAQDENLIRTLNLLILNTFYITPYLNDSFYEEFYRRLDEIKNKLNIT